MPFDTLRGWEAGRISRSPATGNVNGRLSIGKLRDIQMHDPAQVEEIMVEVLMWRPMPTAKELVALAFVLKDHVDYWSFGMLTGLAEAVDNGGTIPPATIAKMRTRGVRLPAPDI